MTNHPPRGDACRSARVVRSVTPLPRPAPVRPSLDDVAPLGPGAARGAEGAVGALLAGGGGEPLVEDLAGGRGEEVADPFAFQRLLRLHLGQRVAAVPLGGALAQL